MNKTIYSLLLCLSLCACTTTGDSDKDAASVDERGGTSTPANSANNSATTFGAGDNSRQELSPLDDPTNQLAERIIYFGYDSSDVQEQYRSVIEAHASYLIQNPGTTMSLEGHADERGSREYNLALGERRSIAIKRQMTVLGAGPSQIRTISYGEERALVEGHDEFSWSQNRRVEIIY
jgi:peptidoglycan-associated lipoprotein